MARAYKDVRGIVKFSSTSGLNGKKTLSSTQKRGEKKTGE